RATRNQPAKLRWRTRAPQVELLEDRMAPAIIDFTAPGAAPAVINGALFAQANGLGAGGSTFLKIQNNGVEQGYNTNGTFEFDTRPGSHALRLAAVPTTTIGGVAYREFVLDINEPGNLPSALLALNELRLYLSTSSTLTGYNPATMRLGGVAPSYDMGNNVVELNGTLQSGNAPTMIFLAPNSLFAGLNPITTFVY